MEPSDRRTRADRSRSISSIRDPSRTRPKALSFSRSPSPRGRRPRRTRSLNRAPSSTSSTSSFSSPSRSRSRRRLASRAYRKSNQSSSKSSKPSEEKPSGALAALKSAAPLLATIGVASVVAHKFWPKGVLFGDKEDWETKKVVERRARTLVTDERGEVKTARSVRQRRDGDRMVVDEVVRGRGRGRGPEEGYREEERRYARLSPQPPPPPPQSSSGRYERGEQRAYLGERYQPRQGDRYEDPRYNDAREEERIALPRGYADDRSYLDDTGYDERGRRRW